MAYTINLTLRKVLNYLVNYSQPLESQDTEFLFDSLEDGRCHMDFSQSQQTTFQRSIIDL